MLAAFLIAVLATPTPEPSEPLETIGHVKTRALCSAMREKFGPSIAALIQNDAIIHDGTQQLFYMDRDAPDQWLEMDKLRLENDVEKIVRNLNVIYRLIEVATADESKAEGTDRETIEKLKNKLRKIADSQREELNTLDGTLESAQVAALKDGGPYLSTQTADPHLMQQSSSAVAAKTADVTPYDLDQLESNNIGNFVGHPGGPGYASMLGIRATKRSESDFAMDFVPLVAQCQDVKTP